MNLSSRSSILKRMSQLPTTTGNQGDAPTTNNINLTNINNMLDKPEFSSKTLSKENWTKVYFQLIDFQTRIQKVMVKKNPEPNDITPEELKNNMNELIKFVQENSKEELFQIRDAMQEDEDEDDDDDN